MIDVRQRLELPAGASGSCTYHSLPRLEKNGLADVSRLPVGLRILLERRDGRRDSVWLVLRVDTPIEATYFAAGGILPYVLEQLLGSKDREEGSA